MPMQFDENFNLHVEKLVYEVLDTRKLTVREVELLKDALKESMFILLTEHTTKCALQQKERFKSNLEVAIGLVTLINIAIALGFKFLGA